MRGIYRSPACAALIVTLGLGIGANPGAFSAVARCHPARRQSIAEAGGLTIRRGLNNLIKTI